MRLSHRSCSPSRRTRNSTGTRSSLLRIRSTHRARLAPTKRPSGTSIHPLADVSVSVPCDLPEDAGQGVPGVAEKASVEGGGHGAMVRGWERGEMRASLGAIVSAHRVAS